MHTTSSAVVICTVGNPMLQECIETLCRQSRKPDLVAIVWGGAPGPAAADALDMLNRAGIEGRIASCAPNLVKQRNLLLSELQQDVVYYIDDDAVLDIDYLEKTLNYFDDDADHVIGGVQGVLAEHAYQVPWGLSRLFRRLFLLTETDGNGRLKPSGHPSFSASVSHVRRVEVMMGAAMGFRRQALGDGFDCALERRWWGDDFTAAYEVSRRSRVIQVPDAKFWHKPLHARPEKDFEAMRIQVINRWYIFRRYLSERPWRLVPFLWASLGEFFQSLVYLVNGRAGMLRGFVAGWRQLASGKADL